MKTCLPIVFFLLGTSLLFSQQKDSLDVIHLRNGMIIEGLIINYRKEKRLKLELEGGVAMSISLSDVSKIKWGGGLDREDFIASDEQIKNTQVDLTTNKETFKVPLIETVFLKNGKRLKGRILDYQKGEQLTLVDAVGNSTIIKEEEISRIIQQIDQQTLNRYIQQRKKLYRPLKYGFKEKGVYFIGYIAGFGNGNTNENKEHTSAGLHFLAGYQWNRLFGTGMGIGIDGYESFSNGANLVPIYLETRGYFRKKWQSPFYSLNAGYAFPLAEDNTDFIIDAKGGWHFQPALGWRFGGAARANFIMDIGYKFQEAYIKKVSTLNGDLEIRDILYQRFTLRIGLVF